MNSYVLKNNLEEFTKIVYSSLENNYIKKFLKRINNYFSMFGALKLGPERANIVLFKGTIIFAFIWSYYWNHPMTAKVSGLYGRQAIPRKRLNFNIITSKINFKLYFNKI